MKITVNYSVNEALETVKTTAAIANELGKTPDYTSKMFDMILDDNLQVEHKSKGTHFTAKHNEFSFEISDTMYLEVLPLIIKFANVVTPIVRGFYNLLQMTGNSFDGLKSSFKEFRKNWSVDIKDNKFCIKTVETDDFGDFKIVLANDGYHTYVYQVNYDIPDYSNKMVQTYVDALIIKYNNTAMDTSEFTMTYDEVNKIVKLHD